MEKVIKNIILWGLNLFYPIFRRVFSFQVYAYLSVGTANTFFNISLFILFYFLFNNVFQFSLFEFAIKTFSVELATIFSFLISVPTGFWLNKNFAFTEASNEKKEKLKQFSKYSLVALQGQFTDYLLTKGMIIFLNINANVAYLISTVIMLLLTYFLQKYFTFKTKKTPAK